MLSVLAVFAALVHLAAAFPNDLQRRMRVRMPEQYLPPYTAPQPQTVTVTVLAPWQTAAAAAAIIDPQPTPLANSNSQIVTSASAQENEGEGVAPGTTNPSAPVAHFAQLESTSETAEVDEGAEGQPGHGELSGIGNEPAPLSVTIKWRKIDPSRDFNPSHFNPSQISYDLVEFKNWLIAPIDQNAPNLSFQVQSTPFNNREAALFHCATSASLNSHHSFNLIETAAVNGALPLYRCNTFPADASTRLRLRVRDNQAASSFLYTLDTFQPRGEKMVSSPQLQQGLPAQIYVTKAGQKPTISAKYQFVSDTPGYITAENRWARFSRTIPSHFSIQNALEKCADYAVNMQPYDPSDPREGLLNRGNYLVGHHAMSFNFIERANGFECVTFSSIYLNTFEFENSRQADETAIHSIIYGLDSSAVKTRKEMKAVVADSESGSQTPKRQEDIKIKVLEDGKWSELTFKSIGHSIKGLSNEVSQGATEFKMARSRSYEDALTTCARHTHMKGCGTFILDTREDFWVCRMLKKSKMTHLDFVEYFDYPFRDHPELIGLEESHVYTLIERCEEKDKCAIM